MPFKHANIETNTRTSYSTVNNSTRMESIIDAVLGKGRFDEQKNFPGPRECIPVYHLLPSICERIFIGNFYSPGVRLDFLPDKTLFTGMSIGTCNAVSRHENLVLGHRLVSLHYGCSLAVNIDHHLHQRRGKRSYSEIKQSETSHDCQTKFQNQS